MYLTATGMACPVGLSAAAACAAMRAGIAKFDELPYLDNYGEPVIGAVVPGLESDFQFEQRLTELLSIALTDCLSHKRLFSLEKVPLLLGIAEIGRPGVPAGLGDRIISQVQEKLQIRFHQELSHAIPQGHTAGFEALRTARELLQDLEISACLICGVDSYIDARALLWLDQYSRLKTGENSDGVIPGEAAAAVLIQRQPVSGLGASVRVTGLGFGCEKATILSDEPLLGLGLVDAARSALAEAGIQMHDIYFRISDVTGESYGFKEQALALSRLMRVRREDFPIWHCADSIGDTGAAASICQLTVVLHAFLRSYAPGNRVMCYASAVPGDRAVAVLQCQRG